MGDLINAVHKLVVFLLLLKSCSGVIYNLNATEYARMPPLYALDTYEECLVQPGGLYCVADFDLFTEEKSELMDMIHEYSALTFTHFNHTQIHRGICVSHTCRDFLKENTLNHTLDLNATLERCLNKTMWNDYGLQARLNKINYCKQENETRSLDSTDTLVATSYFVIIALNIMGTFYDILFCEGGKGNVYLLSFSLRRNWRRLIASADDGPEPRLRQLKLFHGIKTLTMVCVLFSHTALILSKTYLENPLYIELAGQDLSKQILFNGTLVTHTFFMMSSFLIAYNFQLQAEKHKISWWQLPKAVFLRWLRLVSVFALILGTVATLMRSAGKGPLWDLVVTEESNDCREYWWSNLLFINNYLYGNSCMIQSWYMACDFQLFILGMVICIIARTPRAQTIVISITMTVGAAIVGAHTYFQNLDAVVIQTPEKFRDLYENDDTFRYIFIRGHTNMSTYIMGLAAGFITYYIQQRGIDVSKYKRYRWFVWLSMPMAIIVILSGGIFYSDKVYPKIMTVLYAMFYKQTFQFFIIVIILGAIFKIEDVQRRLLEWRGFTWMSRVSYNTFLVHTLFQRAYCGTQTSPIYVNNYYMTILLAATVLLSFSLGAILWLGVESPLNAITKVLLQPSRSNKDKKEVHELPPVNGTTEQINA